MTIKLAVNTAQKINPQIPHQLFSPWAYISSSEMLVIILVIHALARAWYITLADIPQQIGQVKNFVSIEEYLAVMEVQLKYCWIYGWKSNYIPQNTMGMIIYPCFNVS